MNHHKDTPVSPAEQSALQVAFESISDLYKIVERLEAEIEGLHERISKAGRVS